MIQPAKYERPNSVFHDLIARMMMLVFVFISSPLISLAQPLEYYKPFAEMDNHRVNRVLADAKRFTNLAEQCADQTCPFMDCRATQEVNSYVNNVRYALRNQTYWWTTLSVELYPRLIDTIESTSAEERLVYRQQELIAVQRYLFEIGSALADVSSIVDTVSTWESADANLEQIDSQVIAEKFDALYELGKDIRSLNETTGNRLGLQVQGDRSVFSLPDVMGFQGEDLDTLKSHASDVEEILKWTRTLQDEGSTFRAALQNRGASTGAKRALGQIIARVLGRVAEARIEKAERSVAAVQRMIEQREGLQGEIFDLYRPIAVRRDLLTDAYEAYEGSMLNSAGFGLVQCFQRLCPSLNVTAIDPGRFEEQFLGDLTTMTDGGGNREQAINYWNTQLQDLWDSRSSALSVSEAELELRVSKGSARPDDRIRVNADVPACEGRRRHLRITAPSGDVLSEFGIRDASFDTSWTVPDEVGPYRIELLDNYSPAVTRIVSVSDASRLVGVWQYDYEDAEIGTVSGIFAIRPDLKTHLKGGNRTNEIGELSMDGDIVTGRIAPYNTTVEMKLAPDGDHLFGKWFDLQTERYSRDRIGVFERWEAPDRTAPEDRYFASGTETWTRLSREIHQVDLLAPDPTADYSEISNRCYYAYSSGNDPEFHIRILSENLPHWQWELDSAALNVRFLDEPELYIYQVDAELLENGDEVLNIWGRMHCYDGTTEPFRFVPGKKTLLIDGQEIEIEIQLSNYTGPPTVETLRFVSEASGVFVSIQGPIQIGSTIAVEVEFSETPGKDSWPVNITIPGSENGPDTIEVTRVGANSKLYRSKSFLIER